MTPYATADGYTSKHFTLSELACKHCGSMDFSGVFLQALDELRDEYGRVMSINSGFRCALHPEEVKKPAGPGEHNRGAVDVSVMGPNAFFLIAAAMKLGWSGIGVQQKGAQHFIHLDRGLPRPSAPRPAVWSY